MEEDEILRVKVGVAIMPCVSDCDLSHIDLLNYISVNSDKCRSTAFSASGFFQHGLVLSCIAVSFSRLFSPGFYACGKVQTMRELHIHTKATYIYKS